MWSVEARQAVRTARVGRGGRPLVSVAIAFAAAAAIIVGGCADGGLRPLHATSGIGGGTSGGQKLARVDYETIPGRVGQRIRNELIFQSTGSVAKAVDPAYRVEIALRESMTSTLVARSGDASGQIYTVDAKFQLIRIADRKLLLEGTSHARGGFERFSTIYSNVRAREDAENRAAQTIATDIKTRVAAFLSRES